LICAVTKPHRPAVYGDLRVTDRRWHCSEHGYTAMSKDAV